MPIVKIALAGASGTGKTAAAKAVAEKHNLAICPIGSRSVAKDEYGVESPYELDKRGLRPEFMQRLHDKKSAWEGDNERIITDRTHLDNLAYWILEDVRSVTVAAHKAMVQANACYDAIFFFPVEVFHNIDGDASRVHVEHNPLYHETFDLVLWSLLTKHKFPHQRLVRVQVADLGRRVDLVSEFIWWRS